MMLKMEIREKKRHDAVRCLRADRVGEKTYGSSHYSESDNSLITLLAKRYCIVILRASSQTNKNGLNNE